MWKIFPPSSDGVTLSSIIYWFYDAFMRVCSEQHIASISDDSRRYIQGGMCLTPSQFLQLSVKFLVHFFLQGRENGKVDEKLKQFQSDEISTRCRCWLRHAYHHSVALINQSNDKIVQIISINLSLWLFPPSSRVRLRKWKISTLPFSYRCSFTAERLWSFSSRGAKRARNGRDLESKSKCKEERAVESQQERKKKSHEQHSSAPEQCLTWYCLCFLLFFFL